MNKKFDLSNYLSIINGSPLNKEIYRKILRIIEKFNIENIIYFDKDTVYGKVNNKEYDEFFELVNKDNDFSFNYKTPTISFSILVQVILDNLTKISISETSSQYRSDKTISIDKRDNEYIYDNENRIHYESFINVREMYSVVNKEIQYLNSTFNNNFLEINKTWYLENGKTISYILKNDLYNDKTQEKYLICDKPLIKNRIRTYDFKEIDKIIFKELLQDISNEEKVLKERQKRINF